MMNLIRIQIYYLAAQYEKSIKVIKNRLKGKKIVTYNTVTKPCLFYIYMNKLVVF